ncbi:ADP-ribosylglycohydrolase family protein [Amycolatopsis thermalba]|uniref:ADP-ribosylglycohydrolase family protein n=1 Tax=Amycolatopsis thermalba TaxID=944492 RepID=UPI000E24BF0F|nr:ADP-ribosylglycohydrolase family protein [Amycolatopsis thermalba]
MEAAEAVAKVEEWLREVHGPSADLRVDQANLVRRPEGWYVPYNSAAFLDGGDPGERIVPPPALIVRDPEGDLRHASPIFGGLSIPAQYPGRDHWAEMVDPEYAGSGLGRLAVPLAAIMGWRRYLPDGTETGETRANPEYRTGPSRRGYPMPWTTLDSLVEFRHVGWLDQRKFVLGLLEESVLVPLADGRVRHQSTTDGRRRVELWTSSRFFPPGSREWFWLDPVTLLSHVPEADLVIHGPWQLPVEVTTEEIRAAHAEFPRYSDKIEVTGECVEASADLTRWATDTAARIGLPEPVEPPVDAGDSARAHGFELTGDECYRVVTGRSWVRRMAMALPPRPPYDPAAFGLTPGYDDDGRPTLRVDSFGKFADVGQDTNFSWQRLLGAYVGFALGEALGAPVDRLSREEIVRAHGPDQLTDLSAPGRIGPLTQRLLFLTEAVLRGGADAAREATTRWLHTQGETVPGIDGWLPNLDELHAVRDPDPADLRSGPAVLLGALPGVLTIGGRGEVPFGASEAAVRAFAALPESDEGDLTFAVFLGLLFERSLEREFSPALWVSAGAVLRDREGPGWDAVRDLAARSLIAIPEQGMYYLPDPEEVGDGRDTPSVLGRALAAVTGFENNPEVALLRAVNHSGRSALTGAIAGALVGARNGVPGLPPKWVDQLELKPLIERVVTDVTRRFEGIPEGEEGQRWLRRYPAIRP